MDYRTQFAVEPGAKVRLSKIDPSYTGKHENHDAALPDILKNVERMDKLQYLLYADASQSLLVVLQALDAAGKSDYAGLKVELQRLMGGGTGLAGAPGGPGGASGSGTAAAGVQGGLVAHA